MFYTLLAFTAACISVYSYMREVGRWRRHTFVIALLARLMAIFLLWLLLSQFELNLKSSFVRPHDLHLLIDTSESMHLCGMDRDVIALAQNVAHTLSAHQTTVRLHIWAFDEALKEIPIAHIRKLKFKGERTELVSAISSLKRLLGTNATVVVLTDGQDTKVKSPYDVRNILAREKSSGANWVFVRLEREAPANVCVEVLPPYTIAFPNSVVTLRCVVRLTSGNSYSGMLRVTMDRKEILHRRISLSAEHPNETVMFSVSPHSEHRIKVKCDTAPNELFTLDNEAEAIINIINRKVRLLFITGLPSPEFKFIKRSLEDDGAIDMLCLSERDNVGFLAQGNLVTGEQVLRLSVDRNMLSKFDIIFISNIEPIKLPSRTFEEIEWYVSQYGGTLFILGGEKTPTLFNNVLFKRLSPAEGFGGFINNDFSLKPTELGLHCPAVNMGRDKAEARSIWEKMPKLRCGMVLTKLKGGASVLLEYDGIGSAGGAAFVWHRYGEGKVFIFAPFDTWRWCMEAAKRSSEPREFNYFWRTLARSLPTPLVDGFVTLSASNSVAEVGEVVCIYGAVRGNARSKEINVLAQHEDGTKKQFTLVRQGDTFVGQLRLDRQGRWMLKPSSTHGSTVFITAVEKLHEHKRVGHNEEMLKAMADALGGQIISPGDVKKVALKCANMAVKEYSFYTLRLRSMPFLYFAILTLLSLEWFLRRRNGLV
ncbi:MAG: hypothetical protein RUDDFDWM_001218 [Candidatus Fervidibacterota bacterium]